MSERAIPNTTVAAPLRLASTVILIRPAPPGYEVFMVRRPARAAAFADAFVFPGGGVQAEDAVPDPVDGEFSGADASAALSGRGGTAPASFEDALGFYRAALRELFEEAGVLLSRDADGRAARIDPRLVDRWESLRREVQAGRARFVEVVRDAGLVLDHRALAYFSHWITPRTEARRFDTRFFVAAMPAGQLAAHCAVETTASAWISPADALAGHRAGHFPLVFPTRKHLEVMASYPEFARFLAFARTKPIRSVQPDRAPVSDASEIPLGIVEGECW